MFGIGSIISLFSPRPAQPPQIDSQNSDLMRSLASVGANGSFHFGHCHPQPTCRPQPPCNAVLPQPEKKGGFLSKLFAGIGTALSNAFKPITSALSGIASAFGSLFNAFKGIF